MSTGNVDQPGYLPPQIKRESHYNVNLCLVFSLKVYLCHNEPSRKMVGASHVNHLFWGNNRQHMPVCTKKISSCVRQVLIIAKEHVSLTTVQGAATSTALVAVVSLVSILQTGDLSRVSTPARHYFSTYLTATDWHQCSLQYAIMGLGE